MSLTENEIYKLGLQKGINSLQLTRDWLFFSIINIAMKGKLNYPPTAIELKIDFPLDENFIEKCTDVNVEYLYKLLKEIDGTISTIANINNLKMEEIK